MQCVFAGLWPQCGEGLSLALRSLVCYPWKHAARNTVSWLTLLSYCHVSARLIAGMDANALARSIMQLQCENQWTLVLAEMIFSTFWSGMFRNCNMHQPKGVGHHQRSSSISVAAYLQRNTCLIVALVPMR